MAEADWGGGRDAFIADVAVKLSKLYEDRLAAEKRLVDIEALANGLQSRFGEMAEQRLTAVEDLNAQQFRKIREEIDERMRQAEGYFHYQARESVKTIRPELMTKAAELRDEIADIIKGGEDMIARANIDLKSLVEEQKRALSTMRWWFVACLAVAFLVGFHMTH
jgi:CHASE3 domain sensor protein